MKPETRLWKWLEGALPSGHFCRVEPPPSPGIPDVNYCLTCGTEGWIELKIGGRGPYPFARKGLRLSQRRWIRKRLANTGRVFVIVGLAGKIFVFSGKVALTLGPETPKADFHSLAIVVLARIANDHFKETLQKILMT